MSNLITKVSWNLFNHCKAQCSYCPSRFWNGDEPRPVAEYLKIAQKLIDNYKNQGRTINWSFNNGGEPLDMFDFPEFLKLCSTSGGTIDLTTNGGRLWLDWWAVEPYITKLQLSYHYWQNPNLIRFIIQAFQKNNKKIDVIVPIRPGDDFEFDWNRALELEKEFNIATNKSPLFKEASGDMGFLNYTEEQYETMFGKKWVEDNLKAPPKTFTEINIERRDSSPSFTGKLCNTGIELLFISAEGWVRGSSCNNTHLGNIWEENFQFPTQPSICKMISCTVQEDQQITKF